MTAVSSSHSGRTFVVCFDYFKEEKDAHGKNTFEIV